MWREGVCAISDETRVYVPFQTRESVCAISDETRVYVPFQTRQLLLFFLVGGVVFVCVDVFVVPALRLLLLFLRELCPLSLMCRWTAAAVGRTTCIAVCVGGGGTAW